MMIVLAAALAAGPLAVVRLEEFEFRKWHIACDTIAYDVCRATLHYRRDCLSMYFNSSEAYVEIIPRCDGNKTGPRHALALPLHHGDDTISDSIRDLIASDRRAGNQPSPKLLDDAETVGMLLHKITNEPAP